MSLTEIKEFKCLKCGGDLKPKGALYQCEYCHAEFVSDSVEKEREALAALLDGQKQEKLANLRRLLWAEIHEEYIDSEKIVELCVSLRKILPEDFAARFFEVANGGSEGQVNAFLRETDLNDPAQRVWAEETIKFMLKSLRAKNLLAVQNLIERAFKDSDLQKYEKYSTAFSREAERVNGGVYEPSLPRDVFVMYSSKDMKTVEALVETLEERGLTCFVAARNLQHGRGATANYGQALEKAMSACRTIVFVSSKSSRSMACDAVRLEIPYFMEKDKENAPYEYRQRYDKMPAKYKKARVEYRLDNEKAVENSIVKEFFGGLEYAYSKEEVAKRIEGYLTEKVEEETTATKTPDNGEAEKKYRELLEKFNRLQEQKGGEIGAAIAQTENKVSGEFRREGSYAYFGTYPQSEGKPKTVGKADENGYFDGGDGCRYVKENGKYFKVEPIKWQILTKTKGKMLLLSEKILDCKNHGLESYGNGPSRSFLNEKFLKKAFTKTQQKKILEIELTDDLGKIIKDKIFLLSKEEVVSYGLTADDKRKGRTDYAGLGGGSEWMTRSTDVFRTDKENYFPFCVKGDIVTRDSKEPYYWRYVPALWVEMEEIENEPPVVENNEVTTKKELTKGVIREGDYIWFGEYPQSKKAANVIVYDGTDEDGYHRASDGCRYIKAENGKHYKVEPIKWRILYEDGKTFKLLADQILEYSKSVNGGSYYFGILEVRAKKEKLSIRIKDSNKLLPVDEIKERISIKERMRKPTEYAKTKGKGNRWWLEGGFKTNKELREGDSGRLINYNYAYVVTEFGVVGKVKQEKYTCYSAPGYFGGRVHSNDTTYSYSSKGIVPCITIEILE